MQLLTHVAAGIDDGIYFLHAVLQNISEILHRFPRAEALMFAMVFRTCNEVSNWGSWNRVHIPQLLFSAAGNCEVFWSDELF